MNRDEILYSISPLNNLNEIMAEYDRLFAELEKIRSDKRDLAEIIADRIAKEAAEYAEVKRLTAEVERLTELTARHDAIKIIVNAHCGNCQFFKSLKDDDGDCKMMPNVACNKSDYCTSWQPFEIDPNNEVKK